MPKSLSDRLEDLEDEIQLLLTLKNSGGNCDNKGVTVNHTDGNPKQVVFESITYEEESRLTVPVRKCNKSKIRPASSPPEITRPLDMYFKNKDFGGDAGSMAAPRCKSVNRMYLTNDGQKLSICAAPKVELIGCDLNNIEYRNNLLCAPNDDGCSHNQASESIKENGEAKSPPIPDVHKELTTLSEQLANNDIIPNLAKNLSLINKNAKCEINVERLNKAEQEVRQLRSELENKILQLSAAEQEKRYALNKTHELKQKYEKLRSSKSIDISEMERYKKENDDLSLKLEEESKIKSNIENRAKETIERERKILTRKVHKIEVKAVKSAKKLKKHTSRLNKAVQDRDNQIKEVSGSATKLAENIHSKETETVKLKAIKEELTRALTETQKTNRSLCDTNEILVKNVKDLQDALRHEKTKVKELEKMVEEGSEKQNTEVNQELLEAPTQTVQNKNESKAILNDVTSLQAKLAESRKREQIYLDEAALLEVKLQKMKNKQVIITENAELELERLIKDHKNMQHKLEEAAEKLNITEEKYRSKLRTVQEEYKKFFDDFAAKQNEVIKENEELQFRLEQMSALSRSTHGYHEDDFRVLQARCKQQEELIKEQEDALILKGSQLIEEQAENEMLRHHSNQLQIQIELLQQTFDAFEETNDEIETQMEELKVQLKDDRDQLIIKENIIADQIIEIKKLHSTIEAHETKVQNAMHENKMVSEEAKKIAQEMRLVSLELDREIEEKQNMCIEYLDKRGLPKAVQDKVQKLESTVVAVEKLCRQMPCGNEKHKQLLVLVSSLEKKAALVKRETALRMQLLNKQKDQAVYAAKFATHKLMETVTDFQSQVQVHKKVQMILTQLVKEKDNQIKCISYKISKSGTNQHKRVKENYNNSDVGNEPYNVRSYHRVGDSESDY